ncbi:MAG: four helix bundle protein [Candidatus Paceibacterota bacterium]
MRKFEKLDVYQKSLEFTVNVYDFSKKLPDNEKFGIISQLRRATMSISLNIAEGAGSGFDTEFGRFLKIAMRSTYEVHAIIDIIEKLKLSDQESLEKLREELDEISAMIFGLIKKIKKSDS